MSSKHPVKPGYSLRVFSHHYVITPAGLSLKRQHYLFKEIRQFCEEGTEDLVAPKPLAPAPDDDDEPEKKKQKKNDKHTKKNTKQENNKKNTKQENNKKNTKQKRT